MVYTNWYLKEKSVWLNQVKRALYLESEVSIPFFLYRDPISDDINRVCFSSLEEFFRKLASPLIKPVTFSNKGIEGVDIDNVLKDTKTKANEIKILIEKNANIGAGQFEVTKLFKNTQTISTILLSDDWGLIHHDDVYRLLDQTTIYKKSWQYLYTENFDFAIELNQKLRRLGDVLNSIHI